jgi:hypothetical protein
MIAFAIGQWRRGDMTSPVDPQPPSEDEALPEVDANAIAPEESEVQFPVDQLAPEDSEGQSPADEPPPDADEPPPEAIDAAPAAEEAPPDTDEPAPEAIATAPSTHPSPQDASDPTREAVGAAKWSDANLAEAMAAWTEALHSVQRSIDGAADAIRFLRATIQEMGPLWRSLGGLEEVLHAFDKQEAQSPGTAQATAAEPTPPAPEQEEAELPDHIIPLTQRAAQGAQGEQGWQSWRRKAVGGGKAPVWEEADEAPAMPVGPPRATLKPVTLVPDETPAPYAYKVTVEDRKSPIELVQLHRAFLSIPAVRNLSLLNYVNGVASISLETTEEVEPPDFESAIRKTMKKSCSVLPHESNTILIQVGE